MSKSLSLIMMLMILLIEVVMGDGVGDCTGVLLSDSSATCK